VEAKFTDKLAEMRKQLDTRWKQIDKFEASVKAVAEQKAVWRKKLGNREGEVEGLKVSRTLLISRWSILTIFSEGCQC